MYHFIKMAYHTFIPTEFKHNITDTSYINQFNILLRLSKGEGGYIKNLWDGGVGTFFQDDGDEDEAWDKIWNLASKNDIVSVVHWLETLRDVDLHAVKKIQTSIKVFKRLASKKLAEDEDLNDTLRSCGSLLEYTSEEIRNNQEPQGPVFQAFRQDPSSIKWATDKAIAALSVPEGQKNIIPYASKSYVITQVRKPCDDKTACFDGLLAYASDKLKDDKEVVKAAVGTYGKALRYASKELRNNHAIVLVAVTQDGLALEYASEWLRGQRDVVLVAIQQNEWAIHFASNELQTRLEKGE